MRVQKQIVKEDEDEEVEDEDEDEEDAGDEDEDTDEDEASDQGDEEASCGAPHWFVTRIKSIIWSIFTVKVIDYQFRFLLSL